ncbi:MAG: hypothetical protein RLZZ58_50, partial [Pseudomonadota bacterium]
MYMPVNSLNHANAVPIAASAARPDGRISPFARAEWFDLLAAHCFDPAAVATVHASDGHAHVWLPLVRTGPATCRAAANWYSFSYGPVGTPPAVAAALTALAAELRRDTARVTLAPVSARDGSLPALTAAFRAAGW